MRLLALTLRRLAWFVPTLLGLLTVTFVISRVIPGDPVALVAGDTATPAQVEALRRQLGFDRPLPVQFVSYVGRLLRGDMGTSLYTTRPISDDLASRLPATIELTLVAMAFSVVVGIPLGVAIGRGTWRLVAEHIPIVHVTAVAVVPLLLLLPAAIIAANVVTLRPAWRTSRLSAADALRAD